MSHTSDASSSPAPHSEAQPNALALRDIRRRGWAIGLATGLYGISFGALATASGLTVWQAVALSAIMFTGGSQFAFVGVIGGGGGPLSAALAAALLGLRNTVYGVLLAPHLSKGTTARLIQAHLTIDESTANALSGTHTAERRAGFWSAGIGVYVLWNLFTVAGAIVGERAADPQQWGLDAAAAAAFLALLWPRLLARDTVAVAVAAAFIALVTTPLLPAGVPLLAAALMAILPALRPGSQLPQDASEHFSDNGDQGGHA